MLDDVKNVYIKQAEVKGSFDQSKTTGLVSLKELTVNSSLKNYQKVLHEAFEITFNELELRNSRYDKKEKETPKKSQRKNQQKTPVKGLD